MENAVHYSLIMHGFHNGKWLILCSKCSIELLVLFVILCLLRAIFCKSHPTCDSRVFRISSYFNHLKVKVILEHGQNFIFIRHFVEFLGGSRDNSSFSRNAISSHKLHFESPLSLLKLLLRVQITST